MYFSVKNCTVLSFEYFISKRILSKEVKGNKVSRPIVRISVISISLAIVVNLLTVAVVTGFQNEVKSKISGFGAPIYITNSSDESILEANPIKRNKGTEATVLSVANVKHIQPVAYKAVLLQSDGKPRNIKLASGRDTVQSQQEIQGCVFKGVDESFDWNFFEKHKVDGRIPDFKSQINNNEILISKRIATDLNFKVGDRVRAFFVKNSPVKRYFKVVGIYNTGLEDFDKKFIIGNIRSIQRLNDWGIQSNIVISDTLLGGALLVKAQVNGGNRNYRFDWGDGYSNYKGFTFLPKKDTLIRLIVSDYFSRLDGKNETTTLPDTSYLQIHVEGSPIYYVKHEEDIINKKILDSTGKKYAIFTSGGKLNITSKYGKGSHYNYLSGYEVLITDWNLMKETLKNIKRKVEFIPSMDNQILKVSSVMESQSDIFVWLSFLDVNVLIILTLMLLIGIINIGSALLVLILVRTNFIGLMKSMGATDWTIRKIFLLQGVFLVGKGMFWGNLIGLLICFIQSQFHIFYLNPEVYYLSSVPIGLSFVNFLLLNIGTLIICTLALIIPSFIVAKINPSKSIKFN